jgi:iron-sulfur cluster repair protein YtfE (RIC family)
MRMGIQIGSKLDAGFNDPLGMLHDCHRRIEHFLNIVCVVADRAAGRALTDEESAAIQAALSYFRTGGQRHSADEEQSLFPRMRAELAEQLPEIGGLEHDHRDAERLHARVDSIYSAWIANQAIPPDRQSELKTATDQLKKLYEQHIQIEEKIVFPRAAQTLTPEALAAIGQEFRDRRSH